MSKRRKAIAVRSTGGLTRFDTHNLTRSAGSVLVDYETADWLVGCHVQLWGLTASGVPTLRFTDGNALESELEVAVAENPATVWLELRGVNGELLDRTGQERV